MRVNAAYAVLKVEKEVPGRPNPSSPPCPSPSPSSPPLPDPDFPTGGGGATCPPLSFPPLLSPSLLSLLFPSSSLPPHFL